jgi:hypothetical protein
MTIRIECIDTGELRKIGISEEELTRLIQSRVLPCTIKVKILQLWNLNYRSEMTQTRTDRLKAIVCFTDHP